MTTKPRRKLPPTFAVVPDPVVPLEPVALASLPPTGHEALAAEAPAAAQPAVDAPLPMLQPAAEHMRTLEQSFSWASRAAHALAELGVKPEAAIFSGDLTWSTHFSGLGAPEWAMSMACASLSTAFPHARFNWLFVSACDFSASSQAALQQLPNSKSHDSHMFGNILERLHKKKQKLLYRISYNSLNRNMLQVYSIRVTRLC